MAKYMFDRRIFDPKIFHGPKTWLEGGTDQEELLEIPGVDTDWQSKEGADSDMLTKKGTDSDFLTRK